MARGVLVEQRIVEEQAAFGDRRGFRYQRDLAEMTCTFVGLQYFAEHLLTLVGVRFDDPPTSKAHRDTFDQSSLVGQRLGAARDAFDAILMRRGGYFLAGNVRIE